MRNKIVDFYDDFCLNFKKPCKIYSINSINNKIKIFFTFFYFSLFSSLCVTNATEIKEAFHRNKKRSIHQSVQDFWQNFQPTQSLSGANNNPLDQKKDVRDIMFEFLKSRNCILFDKKAIEANEELKSFIQELQEKRNEQSAGNYCTESDQLMIQCAEELGNEIASHGGDVSYGPWSELLCLLRADATESDQTVVKKSDGTRRVSDIAKDIEKNIMDRMKNNFGFEHAVAGVEFCIDLIADIFFKGLALRSIRLSCFLIAGNVVGRGASLMASSYSTHGKIGCCSG